MAPPSIGELRALVVAPTRRDGEITSELLGQAGVACRLCGRVEELAAEMNEGVGVVVLTDMALVDPGMNALAAAMQAQPAWSDIPTLLLTLDRSRSALAARSLDALSNVILLDRPTSTASMLSAVRSALRARRRQYEIRDQLVAQKAVEAALQDADKRKDEFLATLAHELRNPLAAIRTGLEVFVRRPHEIERTERIVGMIDRQSRLLVKLIDELMDVSRIATGKVQLARARVDLRTVMETGMEGAQPGLEAARHTIDFTLPTAPVWVVGDASRLVQVVGNLLNNAGKYTPDGGRISVALTEEDGDAVVRVADTGVGIAPELLEQVFEMFTQVNLTMDRARGGLGIGLSLVRRLVELHGGRVTAQSPGAGRGSTFTVQLPLAARANAATEAEPAAGERRGPRALKVLIVDDNRDVADGLAEVLGGEGHDIRTAYDGLSGLAAAESFAPDILFCDIGMPGLSGHEVATRLRSAPGRAAMLLVAVTGWGNEEDKRLSLDAGFDLHVTKPIALEQVDAILAGFRKSES